MEDNQNSKQIISKKRVTDHGEVYTREREVNAMLDLVKQETERIDSRFLEPACGNGNFLSAILERKLRVVESRYAKSPLEFERKAIIAIGSIYGIDILEDNVIACRERLFEIVNQSYIQTFKKAPKEAFQHAARFILERNIIHGDALTLYTVEENPQPIVFSEWSAPYDNSMIKRREFIFSDLIQTTSTKPRDLFSEPELISDLGKLAFIPKETRSFRPVNFLKVMEAHESKLQP